MQKVTHKHTSGQPPILVKPSRQVNPQHHISVKYMQPTVVKGSSENSHLDANSLAQLEAAKTEQIRQQQLNRQLNIDNAIKLNASKLSEQNQRKRQQTRKIKEQTVMRNNEIKSKYTVTKMKKEDFKSEQKLPVLDEVEQKEVPKEIRVKPTIHWKRAAELSVPGSQQQPEKPKTIEASHSRSKSKSPLRPRSKSPRPQERKPTSKIEIPNVDVESDDESVQEIDSDVEGKIESVQEVVNNFSKIRCALRKR